MYGIIQIGDIYSEEMIQYVVDELGKLQQAVRRLAEKYDCIFVPLQEEFDKALENYDIETEYLLYEDIIAYNQLIVPELEKMGIIINDLHSFVYPNIETYIRKNDNIHLTEEGIQACGKKVAQVIMDVAKTLD